MLLTSEKLLDKYGWTEREKFFLNLQEYSVVLVIIAFIFDIIILKVFGKIGLLSGVATLIFGILFIARTIFFIKIKIIKKEPFRFDYARKNISMGKNPILFFVNLIGCFIFSIICIIAAAILIYLFITK